MNDISYMLSRITQTLVDARKAAGLTQSDVAAALGVTQSWIADIEGGRRQFPVRHCARLPAQIRNQVISAAIQELAEEAAELTAMMSRGE